MSSIVKRKGLLVATAVTMGLALSACGGGFDSSGDGDGDQPAAEGPVELNMLIASSGDAETEAVQDAVKAWGDESGNTVNVTVASDMGQELAQGFASGSPADVFYMDASLFANYAQNGSLYSYGDQVDEPDDFYPALRDTFTYDGKLYCAPKDFRPSRSRSTPTRGRRQASPTPTSRPTGTSWRRSPRSSPPATRLAWVCPPASTGSAPSSSATAAGGSTTTTPRRRAATPPWWML